MKRSNPFIPEASDATLAAISLGLVAVIAEIVLGAFSPPLSISSRAIRAAGVWATLFAINFAALTVFSEYQRRDRKSMLAFSALLATSTLAIAITQLLLVALVSYLGISAGKLGVTHSSIAFALPFCTVVLIIQSIGGLQRGLLAAICVPLLHSFYITPNTSAAPLTLAAILTSCIVACLIFHSGVRSRAAYLRAAVWITAAMLPFALASLAFESPASPLDSAARLFACLISGALSSLLAVAITPIVEYFGEYASDMRLIEMATLDHPLLKELSVQAPGTWNHSMVIGMMVESAASAIGANPVVCRVGAYFHDIGKTKKPLYFAENQAPGENRHDKLSPSMSALIIRSHVKDGIELARRYKLPKVIEEMIPQHHGTSVIDYFYDKARKEAEDSNQDPDTVDRSHYQYPGPRPQTKEAGLLMLADGIEAAARTLSDPSFDRIQGMTQKMLNKVFASGELNECELTLHDLHLIAKCFTRVLTGIYHQRIAYAEPAEKTTPSQDDRGAEARKPDNLKRLGVE
ncbi:MAG: HDIG domain-containing metalloprotein [Pseudomonadota bacterium]|jgi:putative nucleotidyltransferase with HDIG domain